ncbi:hypothetical protein ACE6H2_016710 [Prunus campanulata]
MHRWPWPLSNVSGSMALFMRVVFEGHNTRHHVMINNIDWEVKRKESINNSCNIFIQHT